MALNSNQLKAQMQSRIYNSLLRVFGADIQNTNSDILTQGLTRLSDAISDIAYDIVSEIQSNAEVVSGQQVTGTAKVTEDGLGGGGGGGGGPATTYSGPVQGQTITNGRVV